MLATNLHLSYLPVQTQERKFANSKDDESAACFSLILLLYYFCSRVRNTFTQQPLLMILWLSTEEGVTLRISFSHVNFGFIMFNATIGIFSQVLFIVCLVLKLCKSHQLIIILAICFPIRCQKITKNHDDYNSQSQQRKYHKEPMRTQSKNQAGKKGGKRRVTNSRLDLVLNLIG